MNRIQTMKKSASGSPTHYRKVGRDEPLRVFLDPGNTDVKAMLHKTWGEELVFPHAVRKPTTNDYAITAQSFKNRTAEFRGTAIFQMDDQGFIVGKHAEQVGNGERLLGAEKYRRDHLGALLAASLLQLYPDGHPDVRLVVTHPARITTANMKALWKSVKGVFNLHVADGRRVSFNVTEVIPLEEPVAAFQTFALTTLGQTYKRERFALRPGMEFLIVDIGGWISHLVPGLVNDLGGLEINVDAAEPIQAGIQNVIDVFQTELKTHFEDQLGLIQKLPLRMMHDALMSDQIVIKGRAYDCAAQVENAMQAIASPVSIPYNSKFARGVNSDGIVVSGGGGAVSFDYLSRRLFDHEFAFPAEDDPDRMRFGTVRGASKGLIPFLALG
jgi:hypothetical protein